MHRLSIVQLLSIWSDLEAAYHRHNGFGTDTAEIYLYRLMPWSPSGFTTPSSRCEMNSQASLALIAVLEHFIATHEANVFINGVALRNIIAAGGKVWEHSVHVLVTH